MPRKGRIRRRARVAKGNRFNRTFGRHGYHHELKYSFELQADDATNDTNSFIMPLAAMDITMGNADSVYVNPRHSSYTSTDNHLTYGGSVIKRMHYTMDVLMPPSGQESKIHKLKYYIMPICVKYDDLLKTNEDGQAITNFIPIAEHGTREKIVPNYNGVDLSGRDLPDTDGLTGGAAPEAVTFGQNSFETSLSENSLSPLLLSITQGGLRQSTIQFEYPQTYTGTLRVPKKVQLQTDRTFFGYLLSVGQVDTTPDTRQFYNADELTDVDHIRFNFKWSYYEFNKEFNQGIS